ncbi:hydroxyacylglutathione hydrolase [Marchantia polymorpha subsp. ruderalis]|uniref:hydroxyacylglutathione hydrolase n=2 Tax=Marchantia polymorpha TaxID=3197 RepID=A0A2R6W0E7_MARPO|nr:hypothetical protein MARPO_0204s0005 [Marchantia polymorpha]BBN19291.1 hypothetical protein Mp_8g09430 [Marchantia polymorpha subsp. ruderalis]|eukprot:PTQ27339.1 hypothetical protein MARPO_0204s0005 [Marchantia polymorpha]
MAAVAQISLLRGSAPLSRLSLKVNRAFSFCGFPQTAGLHRSLQQVGFGEMPSFYSNSAAPGNSSGLHTRKQRFSTNVVTSRLQIDMVPCLVDNYAYLLHDVNARVTAVVDPSAAGPVIRALNEKGLSLDFILNTHHHWDHTGGNVELKRKYNAKVVGPRADEGRIPEIDISLREGECWKLGEHVMHVLDTPGHTRGHVTFYFPDSGAVFTGDTLFSMGCGRLFEGTPEQMWNSLSKICHLPDETLVYCGHEYTLSNAKFAMSVEPQNEALSSRYEKVAELRRKGLPTVPTSLGEEKSFNPFLRPFSQELRKSVHLNSSASDVETFAAVRLAKDRYQFSVPALGPGVCRHGMNRGARFDTKMHEMMAEIRKDWRAVCLRRT